MSDLQAKRYEAARGNLVQRKIVHPTTLSSIGFMARSSTMKQLSCLAEMLSEVAKATYCHSSPCFVFCFGYHKSVQVVYVANVGGGVGVRNYGHASLILVLLSFVCVDRFAFNVLSV